MMGETNNLDNLLSNEEKAELFRSIHRVAYLGRAIVLPSKVNTDEQKFVCILESIVRIEGIEHQMRAVYSNSNPSKKWVELNFLNGKIGIALYEPGTYKIERLNLPGDYDKTKEDFAKAVLKAVREMPKGYLPTTEVTK